MRFIVSSLTKTESEEGHFQERSKDQGDKMGVSVQKKFNFWFWISLCADEKASGKEEQVSSPTGCEQGRTNTL